MKALFSTFLFATLALCLTAQTQCNTNQTAYTNSIDQFETLSNTSSTGTHNDETTMAIKPATVAYIIAGSVSTIAIIGCILAMRHFMSRNHDLPFLAVEDPTAPLALSQASIPEVV